MAKKNKKAVKKAAPKATPTPTPKKVGKKSAELFRGQYIWLSLFLYKTVHVYDNPRKHRSSSV